MVIGLHALIWVALQKRRLYNKVINNNQQKAMIKTFKELQEVDIMVADLYKKNPKLKDSKFGYSYKRFSDKNYAPIVRDFNEELGMLRVKHALEDSTTKEVLIDRMNVRGFKYDKKNLVELMQAERKLEEEFYAKEIEVKPFLSTMIPDDMEEPQVDLLKGLVFEESAKAPIKKEVKEDESNLE